MAHWAPGANEMLLREGLGYPMPPGSQLVMQVHYNLLATDGRPGATDQSGIRLRLADGKTAHRRRWTPPAAGAGRAALRAPARPAGSATAPRRSPT